MTVVSDDVTDVAVTEAPAEEAWEPKQKTDICQSTNILQVKNSVVNYRRLFSNSSIRACVAQLTH